jgi:hypothetical protein
MGCSQKSSCAPNEIERLGRVSACRYQAPTRAARFGTRCRADVDSRSGPEYDGAFVFIKEPLVHSRYERK